MKCPECGKSVQMLYGKGAFNGNKNDTMYCEKCYEKIHGEPVDVECN